MCRERTFVSANWLDNICLFVYYHQDTHRHKEPTYGCSHIAKKAIDKMHEHMHKTENRVFSYVDN